MEIQSENSPKNKNAKIWCIWSAILRSILKWRESWQWHAAVAITVKIISLWIHGTYTCEITLFSSNLALLIRIPWLETKLLEKFMPWSTRWWKLQKMQKTLAIGENLKFFARGERQIRSHPKIFGNILLHHGSSNITLKVMLHKEGSPHPLPFTWYDIQPCN